MRQQILCLILACLAGPMVGAAVAQPAQRPAIRDFDIPTIEALGREIYRQDTAAWVGTDALRERIHGDFAGAHLIGWIVVPHGADERVRFLRDLGSGPEAGFDIDVDAARHAVVSEPSDRRLTPEELASFTARQTAARDLPGVCRPGYNSVVTKDPGRDGWLVWMLAPMPQAGAVPVGGHYRFMISADGKTVVERDALFASCMVMSPPPKATPGQRPAALFVSHVVSQTPVETHVFLQLQAGLAMYVLAGDHTWKIDGGRITDTGPTAAKP